MSYIGNNIKKIRTVKKLSQADFSEIFKLSRASVGAYEEGRSEPKVETLIQIASYFGISIDILLTKELTINEIFSFDILNEKLTLAHEQLKSGKKISHEKAFRLVTLEMQLEYIVNAKHKDFETRLPKIELPLSFGGTVRAFEMNGSEMEYHQQGLHHKDILICRKISTEKIKHGMILTVVTSEKVFTKRVSEVDKTLTLSADDPNYEDMQLSPKDVTEFWEVKGVISTYLNPPTFLAERIMVLEKKVNDLTKR